MARTAQEHLDALLEQRDLITDKLAKVKEYGIADRKKIEGNLTKDLLDIEVLIERAEKKVSGRKGPAQNFLNPRRAR